MQKPLHCGILTISGTSPSFAYDVDGLRTGKTVSGTTYRYFYASGTVVASYDYDPYGKVISATGTLANINPLRYRSYVYDQETGFYYLQSRYYDPEICRFINADNLASTGEGIVGHNMFAYCGNNPIIYVDLTGYGRTYVIWGIIKTFYYQKRYIFWGANIAKSAAGQW